MIDASKLPQIAAVTAIVAFGVYRRVRRTIGRQVLTAGRQILRMAFFALVCVVVSVISFRYGLRPVAVAYLVSGLVVGVAVGWFALRHTAFEATPQGYFYTPHLYIGIAVTALFIGRILYRLVLGFSATSAAGSGTAQNFGNSPLTLGILFLTAGYYIVYCTGLLQWLRRAQRTAGARPSPGAPDGASSTSI
ncbi:MAG TPA: hypothetical protein VGG49_11895 [Steroidobacteraceae bacterium]|jgi:hypothetical protein